VSKNVLILEIGVKDIRLVVYSDLETRVRGHSRSSKIIPFNPASMTSY